VRLDNPPAAKHVFRVMCFTHLSTLSASRRDERLVSRRNARGFTLLEILVVLAIIGLVAGLAISKVGGIFDGAKIKTAQLFVNTSVKTPLTTYKIHMSDFPSTAEGLQVLATAPSQRADRWMGPYIEGNKVPTDPWDEPYQYAYPGTRNKGSYDIWSKGPDKQSGTEDDIGNWDSSPRAN
jgi:general secretion pathway protein G